MSKENPQSNRGSESDGIDSLDPRIAHHGAYIDETKKILRTYADRKSYEKMRTAVLEANLLNKRTEEYRTNILREVSRRHIPAEPDFEETPLVKLVASSAEPEVVDWCIYYEFSQDPFVRNLTIEFLYPKFERGTLSVETEDVANYIRSIRANSETLKDRSESTLEEAATKYLSALKNHGVLEGIQSKEFAVTFIPDQVISYIVYRIFAKGARSASEVIQHDDWKLLLLNESQVRRRISNLPASSVNYEKRGSTERILTGHDNINELIDAF
jgi:hypothetical protein